MTRLQILRSLAFLILSFSVALGCGDDSRPRDSGTGDGGTDSGLLDGGDAGDSGMDDGGDSGPADGGDAGDTSVPCPDSDMDGVCDADDVCDGSDDTVDADADGVPDGCDICDGSDDAVDADADGVPDGCDICDGSDDAVDADSDGVPDGCDICDGSDDAVDADSDGVPDGCDICDGSDDTVDADADGVPDGCDICAGSDDTVDADADGVPDGCDICAGSDDTVDADADGVPDGCDICAGSDDAVDADADGVPDGCDACPGSDDTADADADGVPDGCDVCPGSDDLVDGDGDGVPDGCDICAAGDDGVDSDGDGVPDACDVCGGIADVDPGEDDDDVASAQALGFGTPISGTICGDDDYFEIDMVAGCGADILVSFVDADGDIDVHLIDDAGTIVRRASSSTDDETISFSSSADGTYYVRVFGFGTASNSYTITATDPCDFSCPGDDPREDDDTLATAAPISAPGTITPATICPSDEDFYEIALSPGCAIDVDVLFSDAAGDIDVQLQSDTGGFLDGSSSSTDDENVSYTNTSGSTELVYVRVYGFAGAENDYRITYTDSCGGLVCPADDPFEDNDTSGTAEPIVDDSFGAIICGADDDYFEIDVAAACTLTVDALFTDAYGDIDLQLINGVGTVVDSSTSVTDDEQVSATPTADETYSIRVYGFGSFSNYYDLVVDDSCIASCPADEDANEDNDTQATATTLASGVLLSGTICDDDYYDITVPDTCSVTVTATFTDRFGDIDLRLIDASGGFLDSSSSVTDDETVSYTNTSGASQTVTARVFGFGGATNFYGINALIACP